MLARLLQEYGRLKQTKKIASSSSAPLEVGSINGNCPADLFGSYTNHAGVPRSDCCYRGSASPRSSPAGCKNSTLFARLYRLRRACLLPDIGTPVVFGSAADVEAPATFSHPAFAIRRPIPEDQRLSWIVRLLRNCRGLMLAQRFHALVGEMSLIGPRPLLPEDPADEQRRLSKARYVISTLHRADDNGLPTCTAMF